jgi:polyisoprenoid-binding protein YceI
MRNFFFLGMIVAILFNVTSCKDKAATTDTTATGPDTTSVAVNSTTTDANVTKTMAVDIATSKVNWTGSKPTGKHTGTINLKSGSLNVEKGQIVGGSFVLDMNSIAVTDLTGDEKAGLEGHLKGSDPKSPDDFFNVTKHPEATFAITKVEPITGDATATHKVTGNLTIKGVSKEVTMNASVGMKDGGMTVTTPEFTINRTDYGIKYQSKTFDKKLKEKFIDDNVAISINLSAK